MRTDAVASLLLKVFRLGKIQPMLTKSPLVVGLICLLTNHVSGSYEQKCQPPEELELPFTTESDLYWYRITEHIADGRTGVVYKAEMTAKSGQSTEIVALKRMPNGAGFRSEVCTMETLLEALRGKFCDEAPVTDRFAIIKDHFVGADSHYIAMDFAPGDSFSKLCRKHKFSDYTALTLFEEVVKGLAILETTSLQAHGDLHGTNVIVGLKKAKNHESVEGVVDFCVKFIDVTAGFVNSEPEPLRLCDMLIEMYLPHTDKTGFATREVSKRFEYPDGSGCQWRDITETIHTMDGLLVDRLPAWAQEVIAFILNVDVANFRGASWGAIKNPRGGVRKARSLQYSASAILRFLQDLKNKVTEADKKRIQDRVNALRLEQAELETSRPQCHV